MAARTGGIRSAGSEASSRMAIARAARPRELPPPHTEGGMPLMQALRRRHSARSFDIRPLKAQDLSNLLWAAHGVNRPLTRGRTVPSAYDTQEVALYLALPEGLFLHDPLEHVLHGVLPRDLRALAGTQAWVAGAPLVLVYVFDECRVEGDDAPTRRLHAAVDAGHMAQSVYLACASEGLSTVVFSTIDRPRLQRAMQLPPGSSVLLGQAVGYPLR